MIKGHGAIGSWLHVKQQCRADFLVQAIGWPCGTRVWTN
jgi:hypothetical protein